MKRSDFEKELVELDSDFEREGLPARVEVRLSERLAPAPRFQFRPLVLAAVMLVLVTAGVVLWRSPVATLGGFVTRDASAGFEALVREDERVVVAQGEVTLVDDVQGATLKLATGAEVKRLQAGAEVFSGAVRFEVEHRATAPYSVRVSGGVIEVVGTRFTVTQRGTSGEVHLEQGVIRFSATDGRVLTLAPGESATWPPRPVPVPVVVPTLPAPAPPRPLAPPPRPLAPVPPAAVFPVEAVFGEVASLRSRGQFEEAVTVLSAALTHDIPAATRERLSFELGSILSHQLHDGPRACAQWTRQLAEYPAGRYVQAVTAELGELKCTTKKEVP